MSAVVNWSLDPAHSELQFKVRHMMITNVTGSFGNFTANVETDGDWRNARVFFSADVASVNTGNEQRDGHLKSADFFDAEKYPTLSFKSSAFEYISGDSWKLTGELSLHGVTKTVTLDVEFGGEAVDLYNLHRAGFSVEGKINRKDFGLTWGAVTEAGSVVVSDEVKLIAQVQFIKQA